jgi:hypothetical protein
MSLRRDKVFDLLMSKRQCLKHDIHDLKPEDFTMIPNDIKFLFDNSDDKITLIRRWIVNDLSDIQMQCEGLELDLKKYAIFQLRTFSEDFKAKEDEELVLEDDFIKEILSELLEQTDLVLVNELSVVVMNLSTESEVFSRKLLDPLVAPKFFSKLYSTNTKIIENILATLGNSIIDNGISDELLYTLPITNRCKEILNSNYPVSVKSNAMRLICIISKFVTNLEIVKLN